MVLLRISSVRLPAWLLAALLLGTLPTGCKKTDDPAIQTNCRITTRKNEAGITTSTWTYNPDGQVSKLVYSSGERIDFVYNSDGYLTTRTYLLANGNVSTTRTFDYVSGRIIKITFRNSTGAVTSTQTFEYDGAGSLSRLVEAYVGSSTYTYVFTNNKLSGYTARNSSGAESQPYTFDNGFVKRYLSGTSQTNYEYDAQGRRSRIEYLTSGRVSGYTVYDYTEGTDYDEVVNPFKGFPEAIRYGIIQDGYNRGLPARVTNYTLPTTGSTYKSSEYTYTYSKNASGFPLETNYVYREYNPTGTITYTSASKSTYTYEGCQ
ncbi:hypothetical protein [Fibrella arboris]|uniref:hypothetical protein n=1 Tax=Fibrella arboris TaxID=3242486 RepID=UPI003522FFBB